MSVLFLYVIKKSVITSLMIAVILMLRYLLKKAPRWAVSILWVCALLPLLIPAGIKRPLPVFSSQLNTDTYIDRWADRYAEETTVIQEHEDGYAAAVQNGVIPSSQNGVNVVVVGGDVLQAPKTNEDRIVPVLAGIWLTGMIMMMLHLLLSMFLVERRLIGSLRVHANVYLNDRIDQPFVWRLMTPRIYVPTGIREEYLLNICRHEQAHIVRRDYLWKMMGFLVLTVNWFNPLVWLSYHLLCSDIEMACDEKVIRDLPVIEKANYCTALLECGLHKRKFYIHPLSFGEVSVKERVKNVLNYKKPIAWVITAVMLCGLFLAGCSFVDPFSSSANSKPTQSNTSSGQAGNSSAAETSGTESSKPESSKPDSSRPESSREESKHESEEPSKPEESSAEQESAAESSHPAADKDQILAQLFDKNIAYNYPELGQYAEEKRRESLAKWDFVNEIPGRCEFLGELFLKLNSHKVQYAVYRQQAFLAGKEYSYLWWASRETEISSEPVQTWSYYEAKDSGLLWQAPGLDSYYSYYGTANLQTFKENIVMKDINNRGLEVISNTVSGLDVEESPWFFNQDVPISNNSLLDTYRQIAGKMQRFYGAQRKGSSDSKYGHLVFGLCMAELVDFDQDGTEELFLSYSVAQDVPVYLYMVFAKNGDKVSCVYSGDGYNGSPSVDPSVTFLKGNGHIYFRTMNDSSGDTTYYTVQNHQLVKLGTTNRELQTVNGVQMSSYEDYRKAADQLLDGLTYSMYRYEYDAASRGGEPLVSINPSLLVS